MSYTIGTTLSARELILAIIDSTARPNLSAAYLVRAGALYDIDSRAIRVAITRLVKSEALAQVSRGNYGVGRAGRGMHETVVAWSRVEDTVCAWDNSWLAVYMGHLKRTNKTEVRARERALRMKGFAGVDSGIWVRPSNLNSNISELHESLVSLGLDHRAPILRIADQHPAGTLAFGSLWDTAELERLYRRRIHELNKSTNRVANLSTADAARETLQLGRAVTHDILVDPLLPEEMLNTALRREMNHQMRTYDKLAKSYWRDFYNEVH